VYAARGYYSVGKIAENPTNCFFGDFVHWVDLNLALSLVTFIIARIAVFLNSKVCEVNFFFGRNQV